jgi:TonB family protein
MNQILRQLMMIGLVLALMTTVVAQDRPTQEAAAQPPVIRKGYFLSRVIHSEMPIYPEEAKATKASGPVAVEVTVDENGLPLEAHAVSGDPLLRAAAERAALKCRWEPLKDRQPVRAVGKLTFDFQPPEDKPSRKRVTLPLPVFSDKEESRLLKQLDQTPDSLIRYNNQPGAPVLITEARVRVVTPEPGSVAKAPPSDPPLDYRAMTAWISLANNSPHRLTGALLEFADGPQVFFVRSSSLRIRPGGQDQYHILFIAVPFDPANLAVRVVGISLEDGTTWGAFSYWPSPTRRSAPVKTIADTRPVPLDGQLPRPPAYTEDARRNDVMGRISLSLLINEEGNVKQVKVNNALPDGLTDEALRTVYAKKYKPATNNGLPVSYWMDIEFNFNGITEIYRRPPPY